MDPPCRRGAHLVQLLCWRFLQHHGTPLAPGLAQFKQSNQGQLLEYAKLNEYLAKLHKSDRVSKRNFWDALTTGGGKVKRDIDTTLYVGDDFFFNAHHQALFLKEFNQTYRAYFGVGRPTRSSPPWKAEWEPKIAPEIAKLSERRGPSSCARSSPEPLDPHEAPRSQARQKALTESGLID